MWNEGSKIVIKVSNWSLINCWAGLSIPNNLSIFSFCISIWGELQQKLLLTKYQKLQNCNLFLCISVCINGGGRNNRNCGFFSERHTSGASGANPQLCHVLLLPAGAPGVARRGYDKLSVIVVYFVDSKLYTIQIDTNPPHENLLATNW